MLIRRRMMVESEPEPEDLVSTFTPGTYSMNWSGNKSGSAKIAFILNHTYQIVLDATTESTTAATVFLGDRNYGQNGVKFTNGQDGIVTKTLKPTRGTMTKTIWVYNRPSSNDNKNHSITIRSIKIYDIT